VAVVVAVVVAGVGVFDLKFCFPNIFAFSINFLFLSD
jgi:hypothetical protein